MSTTGTNGWRRLFAPYILSRGQAYYESELVSLDAMDEHTIEASVEGTDTYSVEILLRNGRVVQMDCDCPYAAAGNNCKHMAAVLFAAEERSALSSVDCAPPPAQAEREERDASLSRAIAALSEEQLRSLLSDAAKRHDDVRDRITLIGKTAVDPSVRTRWAADLHRISRRASDRHGFIDYNHALDYATELDTYLDEAIAPLLENRLIMDAFKLTGMVFKEALSQDIDDSDGALSFVVSSCEAYWEDLIPAPEADQPKMLDWFLSQIRFEDVDADFLWPVVFEQFTAPELLPKILAMLDKKIESANEYALRYLVEHRIATMERMGASPAKIETYRKKFWAHPFVRMQVLDRLEAEEQWNEALELLRECERLDAQEPFCLAEYSKRRIRILKRSGREQAWLEALKRHIFEYPQRDMTYIAELKQAVSADQWPAILEQLFHNKNTRALRRALQLSEGMLEEIMTELEASRNPYELAQCEEALRKVYPERVRDLLLKQLDAQMRYASTRSAYARTAHELKHLYGYPEGREKAAALAAAWRRDFPRRSAMLDELKKAKL